MMTACGDDAFVDNQQVVTGEETPVAFKINMGNAISTYAGTDFSKGGWSNWKDSDTEMIEEVNARATLQVFANGGTSPYTQVRTVLTEAPSGNDIELPQFRLPAGNSYTAVVWVDFVPKSVTSSSTESRNDYYWKTENLASVSELQFTDEVTNLSTGYNALTQSPVSATPTTQSYFHRPFDVASATSTSDHVNGVKWYQDGDKFYPIFDLNYVIPEKAGKDATYSLSFKGYNVDGTPGFTADAAALTEINAEADGFKLVAIRNASNVPVRTNAHTIIKMNLYKAYSCTVTIVDEFTGGTENIVIDDDDKKQSTDDHFIPEGDENGAHIVVVRGNDGKAISIDITGINKDNFDLVIDDLVAMKNLSSTADNTKPVINMSGTDIPNPADFSDLEGNVTNDIKLTLTQDGQDIVLEGLTNNITLDLPSIQKFIVTSTADVTIEKVVSNSWPTSITAKNVTFTGTTYNSVSINVEETATFNGGTYNNEVAVVGSEDDAEAVINGGLFNHNFKSSVDTTIKGGLLPSVDADGNGVADYMLIMNAGKTLTVEKADEPFGPLFSTSGAGCKLVYDTQDIRDFYSGLIVGNWSNISVK